MVQIPWRVRLAGVPEPTGRGVVSVPAKIVEGPETGRMVLLEIPASRTEAHTRQLTHALQRERTLQAWARGGSDSEQR